MAQQPNIESLSREDRLMLALRDIQSNPQLSQQRAAAIYNVPESTLCTQRARTASQRNTHPNSSRLTRHKEDTIIQYTKRVAARGFAPTLSYVREMADQLLAAHGGGQVGEKWARNLIRQKPEVKAHVTRQRDQQRVLCSNSAIISPWFDLVCNIKAKYDILDKDTYNFDKTGFQIGIGGSVKVVTASKRHLKPLGVQPGNCNDAGKTRDPNSVWSHSEAYGSAWKNCNLRSIDTYRSCTKGLQKTAYLNLGNRKIKYMKAREG
jgi:hypothetical protein